MQREKVMGAKFYVVVGLGITGFSCIRYLKKLNQQVGATDSRSNPPYQEETEKKFPDVDLRLGMIDETLLDKADVIVLSPGVSLKEPSIAKQLQQGKTVIGDIELFAQINQTKKVPIIAITGTNAKSTVTSLVGEMGQKAGLKTKVGGNLGTPVLDLFDELANLYVLELSSFQLETTHSLKAHVASILNITPDHLDRYDSFEAYQTAKHRIYQNCQVAVYNRDDTLTDCKHCQNKISFTLHAPLLKEFGIITKQEQLYLAHGDNILISVRELPFKGKHEYANALASLAIGHAMGFDMDVMLKALQEFKGLAHRCQFVRHYHNISWYNDSKGTNVGATNAALIGLGSAIKGKIILIAGGVGKNADFSTLLPAIKKYSRHVVLIGEAAKDIAKIIANHIDFSYAKDMEEAVSISAQKAQPSDSVLLSPACASFDMFKNYEHRGEVFMEHVHHLK